MEKLFTKSVVILLIGVFLSGCDAINAFDKRLLGEYALPNGYEYISETGQHEIRNESLSTSYLVGTFLNRIYVGKRYVVGEVIEGDSCPDAEGKQGRYCYFILDTESGEYIPKLSLREFEKKIYDIGISNDVRLVSRAEKDWWRPDE